MSFHGNTSRMNVGKSFLPARGDSGWQYHVHARHKLLHRPLQQSVPQPGRISARECSPVPVYFHKQDLVGDTWRLDLFCFNKTQWQRLAQVKCTTAPLCGTHVTLAWRGVSVVDNPICKLHGIRTEVSSPSRKDSDSFPLSLYFTYFSQSDSFLKVFGWTSAICVCDCHLECTAWGIGWVICPTAPQAWVTFRHPFPNCSLLMSNV